MSRAIALRILLDFKNNCAQFWKIFTNIKLLRTNKKEKNIPKFEIHFTSERWKKSCILFGRNRSFSVCLLNAVRIKYLRTFCKFIHCGCSLGSLHFRDEKINYEETQRDIKDVRLLRENLLRCTLLRVHSYITSFLYFSLIERLSDRQVQEELYLFS